MKLRKIKIEKYISPPSCSFGNLNGFLTRCTCSEDEEVQDLFDEIV